MFKFIIRADLTEGYTTAKQYRPDQSADAYAKLAKHAGTLEFKTRDGMATYLRALGCALETEAYPTGADINFASDNGHDLRGMVTYITFDQFRMGNGFKVLKVRA